MQNKVIGAYPSTYVPSKTLATINENTNINNIFEFKSFILNFTFKK